MGLEHWCPSAFEGALGGKAHPRILYSPRCYGHSWTVQPLLQSGTLELEQHWVARPIPEPCTAPGAMAIAGLCNPCCRVAPWNWNSTGWQGPSQNPVQPQVLWP